MVELVGMEKSDAQLLLLNICKNFLFISVEVFFFWKSLSHVRLFATLWTIARQGPLSMNSGQNTGVGSCSFLQGIFQT